MINGQPCKFQVDTGATSTLIGLYTYSKLQKPACTPTNKILKTYGGGVLSIKGSIMVNVRCGNIVKQLPFVVVDSEAASNILGMDWFWKVGFNLDTSAANSQLSECNETFVDADTKQSLIFSLQQFAEIFAPGLGLCKTFEANIQLKPGAKAKFCKPYNVPFALTDRVREELNRLESIGVLKPITTSEWAVPMVVVKKRWSPSYLR